MRGALTLSNWCGVGRSSNLLVSLARHTRVCGLIGAPSALPHVLWDTLAHSCPIVKWVGVNLQLRLSRLRFCRALGRTTPWLIGNIIAGWVRSEAINSQFLAQLLLVLTHVAVCPPIPSHPNSYPFEIKSKSWQKMEPKTIPRPSCLIPIIMLLLPVQSGSWTPRSGMPCI